MQLRLLVLAPLAGAGSSWSWRCAMYSPKAALLRSQMREPVGPEFLTPGWWVSPPLRGKTVEKRTRRAQNSRRTSTGRPRRERCLWRLRHCRRSPSSSSAGPIESPTKRPSKNWCGNVLRNAARCVREASSDSGSEATAMNGSNGGGIGGRASKYRTRYQRSEAPAEPKAAGRN